MDPDVQKGLLRLTLAAHLRLPPSEARLMLREYMRQPDPTLEAEAFAYRIRWEDAPEIREFRLTVANSILFPDSLFGEYNAQYAASDGLRRSAESLGQDYARALESVGLHRAE